MTFRRELGCCIHSTNSFWEYSPPLILYYFNIIPEKQLNTLGLQLIFNPETSSEGLRVFLLAITLYPESANLYDSLGEAYLFLDQKEEAVINFEKSLQLNPDNQNAIGRLEQLKSR